FYISPAGNDANLGTSPSAPWKTINRANQATFHLGDQILFQAGATFSGNLALGKQDAGTPASTIIIGSYGTGSATINAGTGTGILISNTQGISIRNLTIIGSGYSTNAGNGIYVLGNQPGVTLAGFYVDHVDVSGFGHA